MALPDDQIPDDAPEETLPDYAAPDPLAEKIAGMKDYHAAVLDDLGSDPAPEDGSPGSVELNLEKVLDEMSSSLEEPQPSMFGEAASIPDVGIGESPEPHKGKYYVPPGERTPSNREERRAEHDRILEEMRSSVERDLEPPDSVEDFTDDYNNRQSEGFDFASMNEQQNYKTGQSRTNQAVLSMFGSLTDATLDISYELDRLRTRLEQDRL